MVARARFVDAISATPNVRLDLAAAPWTFLKTSQLDPPTAKRARVSTLLTDGAIYPASAYEDRVLELHLNLVEATPDAAATAIQTLARELDRPAGNIFEYRPNDQTHSVFFRTIRLAIDSIDYITDASRQTIVAPVIAEPFGYGLREDPVVDATVSADPAAVSNGCFVDVTGVKGDVETPALIRWPESAVSELRQSLFALRRRGTPSQAPFVFQIESMTQDTDTTVQANDPVFSGGGSNYSRCTFANTALITRVFTQDLGTASVDLRGTYRVFLRYRKNTSGDAVNLRLRWGDADFDDFVDNDTFATPNTTSICMADLGLISVPFGIDPVYDFRTGTELAVDDGFSLEVQAGRESGSGTLDLDCLLLVPADDRFALIEWADTNSNADRRWLDAADWSVHARTSADEVVSTKAPRARSGGLPMLTPNQTNRIYALYEVGEGRAHAIATNTTVSVSYFPRYLSVRPAST